MTIDYLQCSILAFFCIVTIILLTDRIRDLPCDDGKIAVASGGLPDPIVHRLGHTDMQTASWVNTFL
jgi:hypothetical protein